MMGGHKSNIAGGTMPMGFTVARSSKLTIGQATAESLTAGDLAYMDYRRQKRFEALAAKEQNDGEA